MSAPESRRPRRPLAVMAVAAVAIVAAVGGWWLRGPRGRVLATSSLPPPVVLPEIPATATAVTDVEEPAPVATAAPSVVPVARPPVVRPAPPKKVDCNPPYFIDERGHKKYKRACLR